MSKKDLNLIIKAIKKTLNPKKIILFGSYSRGENTKDSDIDLAVLQRDIPKLGQLAKIYRELWEMKYNWKVEPDIHIFSNQKFNDRLKNNSLYIREIMKGKTVYAI